jgi:hypothetical protein
MFLTIMVLSIWSETMKRYSSGIESIEESLNVLEIDKDFKEIFGDFLVASVLNDNSIKEEYSYKTEGINYNKKQQNVFVADSKWNGYKKLDIVTHYYGASWNRIART